MFWLFKGYFLNIISEVITVIIGSFITIIFSGLIYVEFKRKFKPDFRYYVYICIGIVMMVIGIFCIIK